MSLSAIMQEKVIFVAIIMAIGFGMIKLKIIDISVKDALSRIIIRITAPLLIFTGMAGREYNQQLLNEAFTMFGIGAVVIVCLLMIGTAYGRLDKSLDETTRGVQTALMTFGNVSFLAYPIFDGMFPETGIFLASFYVLANDVIFWTVGTTQLNYKVKSSIKDVMLKIFNPNTVAILLGVAFYLLQIKIPGMIFEPLKGLGGTTVFLSLLFIGITIGTIDVGNMLKKHPLYIAAAIKMIIIPALMALFLIRVFNFGLSNEAMIILILEAAMPIMTLVAIVSNEMKVNYKYAAEGVFFTTILSLITLPFMVKFVEYLIDL